MNTRRFAFGTTILVLLVALAGCTIYIDTGASLTIVNNTGYTMDFVSWTDGDGVIHAFGTDTVYDSSIGACTTGMLPGHQDTHAVAHGTAYIYFHETGSTTHYRTAESITVNAFEAAVFRIDGSTPLNIVP